MNNIPTQNYRQELLRTDLEPRKLNEVSKKYKELFLKDLESGKIKTEEVHICQCGSKNLEQLTKIDRFGLPFGSLICKDCGLVITSPRIKEESLPYYYDKYYHPLNYGKEHLENQTALFADGQGKKIFNILKEFLPHKEKLKILEIGAGTGNVLFEFKEEAFKNNIDVDELGTEYSTDCIQIAKQKDIKIIFGDLNTATERKEKFDVVILSHVFEHFIDLQKEIENLKKIMTNETLLYVEVPGIMVCHEKDYYDFSFLGYLVHAHMYNFTRDTLANIFVNNGFKSMSLNEEVEAVFKNNNTAEEVKILNSYDEVMIYLGKLYESYQFLQKGVNSKFEKFIATKEKDIAKLTELVEYRDEQIVKLSTMVENREKDIAKLTEQIDYRNAKLEEYEKKIKYLYNKKVKLLELIKALKNTKIPLLPFYKAEYCEKLIGEIDE